MRRPTLFNPCFSKVNCIIKETPIKLKWYTRNIYLIQNKAIIEEQKHKNTYKTSSYTVFINSI